MALFSCLQSEKSNGFYFKETATIIGRYRFGISLMCFNLVYSGRSGIFVIRIHKITKMTTMNVIAEHDEISTKVKVTRMKQQILKEQDCQIIASMLQFHLSAWLT